jgi:acetylornithine deacetylase/succinyl-diaminopimelate desuccinylase-like protein
MDSRKIGAFVDEVWESSIIPALKKYIEIPNLSPAFDPDWKKNGHMDRAAGLISDWVKSCGVKGLTIETIELKGRTPVLYMEVPGASDDTVLLYGHLDKQPPMEGWSDGLGPWKPVMRDGRLYGRGGADDGYAAFAAVTAVQALQQQNVPHARCVIIIEGCEESGSFDLPHYIDALKDRIGTPSLIVCLDSGCGNYDQLWVTTSLRGMAAGNLTVAVLTEGVHSGDASGIIPSSFRITRQLLSRLEDEKTGRILPEAFWVEIPEQRSRQAAKAAEVLGDEVWSKYPYLGDTGPISKDPRELVLNRTWTPQLEITGGEGFPPVATAGNVLRQKTTVKVSLRLPPTVDAEKATAALQALLEKDPPYGASVTFVPDHPAGGWNAPALAPWLDESAGGASQEYFGKGACYMGEGGSIPFMGMLGAKFPRAQFLITGVLGPMSNAHGPNEFLEIATARRVTACTARVLADHHKAKKG